jgi:thiamine transporter ThiT
MDSCSESTLFLCFSLFLSFSLSYSSLSRALSLSHSFSLSPSLNLSHMVQVAIVTSVTTSFAAWLEFHSAAQKVFFCPAAYKRAHESVGKLANIGCKV